MNMPQTYDLLQLDSRTLLIRKLMQIDERVKLDLRMLLFKKIRVLLLPVSQYILLLHL